MDPKPVVPVNQFNYQPLGLKTLTNNQAFYSTTGTVPGGGTGSAVANDEYLSFISKVSAPTQGVRSSYDSARKYDRVDLGYDAARDNEDYYARHQGVLSSIGSGLGRLALTTLTKTGSGLSYLGAGIVNAITTPFSSEQDKWTSWMTNTADNVFVNFFDKLEDDVKTDLLPIYQDAADREKGFFARAATDLNFWTEDFVDGAAFMASSMLPGAVLSKWGLGSKLVRGLSGTANKADEAAGILKGLTQKGIEGYEALNKVPQITRLMSNAKLARSVDVGVTTAMTTSMEALVEANEVRKTMIESLRGKINPETGTYYTEQEIITRSAGAALDTFKGNMMALLVSNLWETNLLFKKLPSSSAATNAGVDFAEGIFGKATVKNESFLKGIGINAAKGIAAEGIWEENAQLAISRMNASKYGGDSTKYGSSFLDNYLGQLKGAVSGEDKEAALSIGMGAILGGIVGGVMETVEDRREAKALKGKATDFNNMVDTFKGFKDIYETEEVTVKDENNKEVKVTRLKTNEKGRPIIDAKKFDAFIQGHQQLADMLDLANRSEDSKNDSMAAIAQNELLAQFALAHFEMGQAGALKEKLSAITNISEDDLVALGFDPTSKQNGVARSRDIMRKVNELEELYNNIQENIVEDTDNAKERKRKLFQLGSRQQLLVEQYQQAISRAEALDNSSIVAREANKLINFERAATKRLEGLQRLLEQGEIDRDGQVDTELITDTEQLIAKAKQDKEKYLEENKEALKDYKKNPSGTFSLSSSNTIADAKRDKEFEKAAGLQYALVDTTNKFNRIAHPRTGAAYFAKTGIFQQQFDEAEDKDLEDFSEKDINFLNERVTTLGNAAKFDPLTNLYPRLLDPKFPINQKLKLLRNLMKTGNKLAEELYKAFNEDVKAFRDRVLNEKKILKAKEEEIRKAQADKAANADMERSFIASTGDAGIGSADPDAEDKNEQADEKVREEAKKPIDIFFSSTISREEDARPGNAVDRHQHFLINTEHAKFRPELKLVVITPANEEGLGVKGITDAIYNGATVDKTEKGKEPIVALYVRQKDSKLYAVDMHGQIIGPALGEGEVSLDQAIFTYFPSTNPNKDSGEARHAPASESVVKQWQALWESKRAELLALKGNETKVYDYGTSRGHSRKTVTSVAGVNKYERNPVEGTLVPQEEIDTNTGLLQVSTTGEIRHNNRSVKVTPGRVVLVSGNRMEHLVNRNLTHSEAQNVAQLLKILAAEANGETTGKKGFSSANAAAIIGYLQNIIFFGSPFDKDGKRIKNTSANQVYFRNGMLIFGHKVNGKVQEQMVPFTSKGIEQNIDKIVSILEGMYNNVNSNTLSKNKDFLEVTANADGTVSVEKWPSYRHFLLSTKDLKGNTKNPLLATIVRKVSPVVPFDRNLQGVYTTAINMLDGSNIKDETPKTPAKQKAPVTNPEQKRIAKEQRSIGVNPVAGKEGEYQFSVLIDVFEDDIAIVEVKRQDGTVASPDKEALDKIYNFLLASQFPEIAKKRAELAAIAAQENLEVEVRVYPLAGGASFAVAIQGTEITILKVNKPDGTELEASELPQEDVDKLIGFVKQVLTKEAQANGQAAAAPAATAPAASAPATPAASTAPLAEEDKITAEEAYKAQLAANQKAKEQEEQEDTAREAMIQKMLEEQARYESLNEDDAADPEALRLAQDVEYTIGDMQKEAAEIGNMLGVPVKIVENVIRSTRGGWAWGRFKDGVIELWRNAEVGTGYHEAFEAVWAMFLSAEEQQAAVKEFRKRKGEFYDRPSGKMVAFSDPQVSIFQVKEAIAEEFRDFMLKGKVNARKDSGLLNQFFNWLLNLVRSIIGGNSNEIEKIFGKIKAGKYRQVGPARSGIGVDEDRIGDMDASDSYYVIRAVTNRVISEFIKDGGDLTDFDSIGGTVKDVFDAVLKGLRDHYMKKGARMKQRGFPEETIKKLNGVYADIELNWPQVQAEVIDYLNTFSIVTIDENELEKYKEDTERSVSKDEAYLIDHFTYDGKTNAPASIKLLIATLTESVYAVTEKEGTYVAGGEVKKKHIFPKLHQPTQLEMAVKYGATFNQLLKQTGTANTVAEKIELIKQLAQINPNFVRLVNRLKLNSDTNSYQTKDWNLLAKLNATLSRHAPKPLIQYINDDGSSYVGSANLEDTRRVVAHGWLSALKALSKDNKSPIVYRGDEYVVNQDFFKNINTVTDSDKFAFLKMLGIEVDPALFNNLPSSQQKRFRKAVSSMVEGLTRKGGVIASNTKSLNVEAPMFTLTEIIAMMNQQGFESTYFNIENKRVQEYILGNEFATIVNDINNATSYDDLLERLPHLKKLFSERSFFLKNRLFTENGSRILDQFGEPLRLELKYIQGTIDQTQSNPTKPTDSLNPADRFVQEFNQNLIDNYYILLPGDSKTEHILGMKSFVEFAEFADPVAVKRRIYKHLDTYYQVEKQLYQQEEAQEPGSGKERTYALFDPTYSKKHVYQEIEDHINREVQATIDFLIQYKKVEKEGEFYTFTSLNSNFAEENKIDTQKLSEQDLHNLVFFRIANYMMSNTEIMKLFFGDVSHLSDPLKRFKSFGSPRTTALYGSEAFNTHANKSRNSAFVEVNNKGVKERREVELNSPLLGQWSFKDHMKTVSMSSVIVANDLYDNIDSTDAQAWATLPGYREYNIRLGSWDNGKERQYQFIMALDRMNMFEDGVLTVDTYPKELQELDRQIIAQGPEGDVYFQPTKPIVTGFDLDNNDPLLDKFSIVPLSYSSTRGKNLNNHYLRMLKEGVSYTIVNSGRKWGVKDTDSFYKEDGSVNNEAFKPTAIVNVPFKYFGNQVENTSKKFSQTRGSQITKLALINSMANGVPVDFRPEIKSMDARMLTWNTLSEDDKLQASALYGLIRENVQILREMTELGYETLLEELGIQDNGEELVDVDSFEIIDREKVLELLKRELKRREIPDNIKAALEIDELTGDFVIPLEALNNYGQIKSIIYSFVDKYISSPKMNGGPKVQVSGAGFEVGGRQIKTAKDSKGNTVYVSSGLRFYSKTENGGLSKMQVLLPHHFSKQIRKQLKKKFKTDEDLFNYLQSSEEGRTILSGIGFRIPTQEMNSIDLFEIAGFLPEWMGDTIVVPEAITQKSGSDFDIDKLNTYLRNVYLDRNKEVRLIRYMGSREATEQFYGELFDRKIAQYTEYKAKLLEAMQNLNYGLEDKDKLIDKYQKALDNLLADLAPEDAENKIMESLEQIATNRKIYVRDMYKRALENRYFDSLEAIISQPHNFERLTTPNTSRRLTAARDSLVEISSDEFAGGSVKSILSPLYMSAQRHYYLLGKQGVGIAAVSQTFRAVSQLSNIFIDPSLMGREIPYKKYLKDLRINLPHNRTVTPDNKVRPSLSGITNTEGEVISDVISEFINGYVDITKDPFIIQLGADKTLASTFLTLAHLGVPHKIITYFMNQPIIREYFKMLAAEGKTWVYNDGPRGEIAKIKTLFFKGYNNKTVGLPLDAANTDIAAIEKELYSKIKNFYEDSGLTQQQRIEKLNEKERLQQLEILDEFLKYYTLAGNMFTLTQGTNYDTASFTDANAIVFKEIKHRKANEEIVINSANSLLAGTFIGEVRKWLLRGSAAVNTLFKIHHPNVVSAFRPIQEELAERTGQNDFFKVASKVESSFINSMVFIKTGLYKSIHPLMIDNEKNIAARLTRLQHDLAGTSIANNIILRNLIPSLEGRGPMDTKNIRLSEKAVDIFTSNTYTEALKELRDYPITTSFYGLLLRVAFLQSGIARSKTSLTEIIPVEDYKKFIIPVLNSLTDPELLSTFIGTDAFYRTNWNDEVIVPKVKNRDYFNQMFNSYNRNFLTDSGVHKFFSSRINQQDPAAVDNMAKYRIYKVYPNSRAARSRFIKVVVQDTKYTKEQIRQMKRNGDFSFLTTYFMQRVDNSEGQPVTFGKNNDIYYVPTYAWGDSYRGMEYYDTVKPTVYNNRTYIPPFVLPNEQILQLLSTGSIELPEVTSPAIDLSTPSPVKRVISGLQTGVDTVGLEAAHMLGIETGGTATPGFATELGGNARELAQKYGVKEITRAKQAKARSSKEFYLPRTEENVMNSDATVYFSTTADSAGRIATERFAKTHNKPFIANPTAEQLRAWLIQNNVQTLNVAGNRGSKMRQQQLDNVRNILLQALTNKNDNQSTQDKIDECLG